MKKLMLLFISKEDAFMVTKQENALLLLKKLATLPICDDMIAVDNCSLEVIATPGHTIGSVCLVFEDNIFTGDTLFKGSIGRMDLPTLILI